MWNVGGGFAGGETDAGVICLDFDNGIVGEFNVTGVKFWGVVGHLIPRARFEHFRAISNDFSGLKEFANNGFRVGLGIVVILHWHPV